MKKVLILGVNGFIGHHLSMRILATTDWQVYGMDMNADRVEDLTANKRFNMPFLQIQILMPWNQSLQFCNQYYGHLLRGVYFLLWCQL